MSDIASVIRAQHGDHAAFTRLVTEHQGMVYRLCLRITGAAESAEELAHETCVEAFLKLGQLRDPACFSGWLRTLALNLCRMWLRGRRPEEMLDEHLPAREATAPDALATRVTRGLSRLTAPHRVALVLHYQEGLSYEEIATVLDIPIGTVMSRLHRGRRALRQLAELDEDEDTTMTPDENFTRDVDAEISVLLTLFKGDPDAAERLSILLTHVPERLAALIAETEDAATLTHLARVLPRLGKPAIEIVMNCALLDDAATRAHAATLLGAFLARVSPGFRGVPPWLGTPPVGLYLLLDGLTRSRASATRKAELLVALLDAVDDGPVQALLANVLLCTHEEALPVLLARFWPAVEAGTALSTPVLAALARLGTPFVQVLGDALAQPDPLRQAGALLGLDAVARSLTGAYIDNERCAMRHMAKWAPIPATRLDSAVLDAVLTRTKTLLAAKAVELRDPAIRILGLVKREDTTTALQAIARDGAPSSRVAALRALTEIGTPEAEPVLMQAAAHGSLRAERVAAIEGLGRLACAEAVPALIDLLSDHDGEVRQTAATALGDIGGDAARAALQTALKAEDKALMRTAATVLHTSPHFRTRKPPSPELQRMDREVRERLHGELAKPCAVISLHETIRVLPDVRPYPERELTRLIARACSDYSTTRRELIMERLMHREAGIYTLTDAGQAIWRVEQYISAHYLG